MKIGDRQYEASVNQELHRSVEELAAIHAGDNRYVEWLREFSPADHAILVAFPAQVQALFGIMPIKVLAAFLDCQIAVHRFWFAAWDAHEQKQIGKEVLALLTAGTGKVV
jgi:hypothetical protein